MVKLPTQVGRQLIAALAYLKDSGRGITNCRDYLFTNWGQAGDRTDYPNLRRIGRRAMDGWARDHDVTLDEIFAIIGDQISSKDQDSSLIIDRVAEILLNPFARPMLAGKLLEQLRKAVLNPEEIVGLDDRIRARELHCEGCQRPFTSGEVVSFNSDPDNRGRQKVSLFCVRCLTPRFVTCNGKGCVDKMSIPDKLLNVFATSSKECEHMREGARVVPDAPVPDLRDDAPIRRGGVRIAPPPVRATNPFRVATGTTATNATQAETAAWIGEDALRGGTTAVTVTDEPGEPIWINAPQVPVPAPAATVWLNQRDIDARQRGIAQEDDLAWARRINQEGMNIINRGHTG